MSTDQYQSGYKAGHRKEQAHLKKKKNVMWVALSLVSMPHPSSGIQTGFHCVQERILNQKRHLIFLHNTGVTVIKYREVTMAFLLARSLG